MRKLTKLLPYLLVFFFFLGWSMIVYSNDLDQIWVYGFSHNIAEGLIPYKDFNMIVTPFWEFLLAIPLKIFSENMLIFHIMESLVFTILSKPLFARLGKNSWYVFIFMWLPINPLAPSYNIFIYFLLILVIMLEEENKSDYLIGIVLSLIFLTKQSVGCVVLLVSLFYWNKPKKILKRIVGFLGPVLLFFLYLIVTSSFMDFLDLCLFGLFDFSKENGSFFNIYLLLTVLIVGITIYFIWKNPKRIELYYFLAFYTIMIPLFDAKHFTYLWIAFITWILKDIELKYIRRNLFVLGVLLLECFCLLYGRVKNKTPLFNSIHLFEYKYLDRNVVEMTKSIEKYLDKHPKKSFMFLDSTGYYIKLVRGEKIEKLDLINTGNWGHHGSSKLLRKIKQDKKDYYFVYEEELNSEHQTDKEAIRYIINHGKRIDRVGIYDVYTLK